MAYQFVRIDQDEKMATLSIERPPGNLLHIDLMEEINHALLELRGTRGVEVLVLRGSHGTFSEGLDLQEHKRHRVQRAMQVYSRIFETIRMMDLVTIAAVEGRAWGGGFELCLGCNLIVAENEASFQLPEISYGVFPPIAAIVLPRVAPRRRAMEWILTGCEIPAQQLHHFGLVNRLLDRDRFDEELADFAELLCSKSGPVLQLAKRAQYDAYYSTYEEALYKVQNLYLRDLMELDDMEEGISAYLEGREPDWK